MARKKLKIWLSATDLLEQDIGQIKRILRRYDIVYGQALILEAGEKFSVQNHLTELEKCDLFLGIINPRVANFGTETENICLEEIKKAIELGMPYWYLVHQDVTFTRKLLNDLVVKDGVIQSGNKSFFDIRTIDIFKFILNQKREIDPSLKQITEFYRLSPIIDSINASIINTGKRKPPVRLMLASTVYGFEDQLSKIIADLKKQDFTVLNSFYGSIKVNPKLSNLDNCINAVDHADWFLGIVRPYYGSGNIKDTESPLAEDKNITFEEIKKAIALGLPRWFYVHRNVVFSSWILKYIKVNAIHGDKNTAAKTERKNVLIENPHIDPRAIDLYNFVIKDDESNLALRNGNWAQEFFTITDAAIYILTQFSDSGFIRELLNNSQNGR